MEWSIAYCKAAVIDLAVVNHEKDIAALKLKSERANVAADSYDKMQRDARELNFRSFFDQAAQQCQSNLDVLATVVDNDHRQAEELQKELKAFENNYFKEYMTIAQSMLQ